MKRILTALLSVLMVLSLAGCKSEPKYETAVKNFCNALKNFDMETMSSLCTDMEDFPLSDFSDELGEYGDQFIDLLKAYGKKTSFKITESSSDNDKAFVTVSFTYSDISAATSKAVTNYLSQALVMAFSGQEYSDKEIENLLTDCFTTAIKENPAEPATATVPFVCVMNNNEWKIESISVELANVLTCNMLKGIEDSFGSLFEGWGSEDDDSYWSEDDEYSYSWPEDDDFYWFEDDEYNWPEYEEDEILWSLDDDYVKDFDGCTWTDVPAGTKISLATMDITVHGCEETAVLTAEGYEDEEAGDDAKFVIFSLTVDNTSDDVLLYQTLDLFDDEGHHYEEFSYAFIYREDEFFYTSIMPGESQTGCSIYKVPADASNYYIAIGKAGTKEAYRMYGN